MNICLSILPLYVPSTRGVRARLESHDTAHLKLFHHDPMVLLAELWLNKFNCILANNKQPGRKQQNSEPNTYCCQKKNRLQQISVLEILSHKAAE